VARSKPSKTQLSFNDTVLQAQQRAIAVRKQSSFGNSSSGYEFGGWKSLLTDYSTAELSAKGNSATKFVKLDSNQHKSAINCQKTAINTLCPSSQPNLDDVVVFGIVEGTIEEPRVAYLEKAQPFNEELQTPSSPVKPTEMMRLASSCHEKGCVHFDGSDCRLAMRIVEQLPKVTQTLPACQIRSSCRWWQQEGKSACLRCPQVVTENHYSSPLFERVANPNAKLRPV
jgi:hypothetical protein